MLRLKTIDVSFRTAYAQAKELALAQASVPLITAGSIHVEPRGAARFAYRYRYGASGKRIAEYLGPEGSEETALRIEEARQEIAEHAVLGGYAQSLRRLGLYSADNSTIATVATLFNVGIFGGGAVLVGTHAFGALLNELGILSSPFPSTDDIDVVRARRIEVAAFPKGGMLALLRQTGLPFNEVPALGRRAPATSYKVRGSTLSVDLLVPSDTHPFAPVAVPELGAHATGLPFLRYLIEGPSFSMLIGRERLVPVMIPHAGRFCIHKLAVHSLRGGGEEAKRDKDVLQAAMLAAALTEGSEWLLTEAIEAITRPLRRRLSPGARRAVARLTPSHPAAAAALEPLA